MKAPSRRRCCSSEENFRNRESTDCGTQPAAPAAEPTVREKRRCYMAITMPKGKRFAVCFTFDVDVTSLWLGCFKFHTMNPLSRGEFGIRFGLGRILDLLDKYDIKATFYLPGHT